MGPTGRRDDNDGSSDFLNPALIYQGDLTLRTIVNAIHSSKAWRQGHNAIVVVWDENDYSAVNNRVLVIIDTNDGIAVFTACAATRTSRCSRRSRRNSVCRA